MDEKKCNLNFFKIHSFDTIHSADSVEWCPHEPNQHMFVCANYQLIEASENEENQSKRIGKIHLFSIDESNLTLLQTLDTAAILDQKWCHNQILGFSLLGSVDASNQLVVYKLVPGVPELQVVASVKNDEDSVMLLSLDWSTGKYFSGEPTIVASDTKGRVHLFTLHDSELVKTMSLEAHEYEAWISAFYYWNTNVFFTGGDDSKLLQFDLRASQLPQIKSRAHSAGVTCIHSNREKEYLFATGSYDQNLLLWDMRKMKTPTHSLEMLGPMWRLKWDPHTQNHLLAACMLDGFHVVEVNPTCPQVVANYYEHGDLAYGVDWSYLSESEVKRFTESGNRIVGACSFYDHKLTVAIVDLQFEIKES